MSDKKLGGWWRLWIAGNALWLLLLVFIVSLEFIPQLLVILIGPGLLALGLGWAARWVYRGFRSN